MFVRDASHAVVLQAAAQLISDRPLAECVRAGIAFHSAGLVHADRQCVENLFRDGHLYVVSATSTLGMGVNLPAKLVIVKGTSFYEHARGFVPMPRSQVTQLIGRAGRPQFDTSGVALILTEHGSVDFYKRMLLNADEVESHLGESLPEFVCTEVVQKTISDAGEAIHWMNSTFLALRMKKAPHRYRSSSIAASATAAASSSSSVASGSPEKLVLDCVDGLVQKGLLKYSEDGSVSALIGAELLTRYYLRVETVCHLLESANRAVSLEDAFRVLIEAAEFGDFPIRMGEKGLLNDLAKSAATRFPLGAKKVASTADKVSVLLQAMLQSHAIDNWQLKQDGAQCLLLARRVSSAILTLALENTDVVKAPALLAAVRLSQAMRACMWHDSERPLQQLDGVGPQIAWNLSVGKITTLRELNDASVVAIAHASQKSAAWASSLKQATRAFPLLKVQAQLSGSGQAVKILLEQEREEYATPTFPHFAVIVVHVDAVLLLRKRIRLLSGAQSYQFSLKLDAHTTFACDSLSIVAAVDSLAGADAHAKLRLPAERVVLATTPVAAPAASLPAGTVQRSFASKRKSPAGDASGSGGGGSSSSGSGGGDMVSSLREQGRAAGLPSLSKRACVAPNSSLLSNWSAQSATEPFKYKIDMFRLAGDSHPSDSNSSSTSGGNKDIAAAARPTRTPVAEINALSRSEDENSFLSSQNELESRAEVLLSRTRTF